MTLPSTMTAIRVEPGQPKPRLLPVSMPVPVPGENEVLIKVAAAGLNRADLLQAEGRYPMPPGAPETLGMEASGTIVALGAHAAPWRVGDEVCALLLGGGYAEYVAADTRCLLPIPKGVSLKDAASLPEVYFTVWANVFGAGHLKPGESFLVHGGASGIGTAAIQLLAARGHKIFATASGVDKCAAIAKLGARAIDYTKEDFAAVVKAETKGGVDVILDMVGGDYISRNLEALAKYGRLVNIGYQKGIKAEVDFRPLLAKHLVMTATTLRGRSYDEKADLRDTLLKDVWPLIESGRIKPIVDSRFALAKAEEAHQRMRESRHIGKILLEP